MIKRLICYFLGCDPQRQALEQGYRLSAIDRHIEDLQKDLKRFLNQLNGTQTIGNLLEKKVAGLFEDVDRLKRQFDCQNKSHVMQGIDCEAKSSKLNKRLVELHRSGRVLWDEIQKIKEICDDLRLSELHSHLCQRSSPKRKLSDETLRVRAARANSQPRHPDGKFKKSKPRVDSSTEGLGPDKEIDGKVQ